MASLLTLCGTGLAPAAETEESWSFSDESTTTEGRELRQARAAIYRGDLVVALRCNDDGTRRWETFVVGATWFLQPKAHLSFELSVDEGEPMVLEFDRETNFRFALEHPPRGLIEALGQGSQLTIGGADFAEEPRAVPLRGSREALDGAFGICGYDPLEG